MADPYPEPWGPSVLSPVVYGYRDYGLADGTPVPVRVYFPSLDDTSPQQSPILEESGAYPLVLMLHGHCIAPATYQSYLKWVYIPYTLSRSGYVVAVPEIPGIKGGTMPFEPGSTDYLHMFDLIEWMQSQWVHKGVLTGHTAAVGHSFGALLAGMLAYNGPIEALVLLSGGWGEVDPGAWDPVKFFGGLGAPVLYTWSTDEDPAIPDAALPFWELTTPPRHSIVFTASGHWDYVPSAVPECGAAVVCSVVERVVGDFATTFLTKYFPPNTSGGGLGAATIPDTLLPLPVPVPVPDKYSAAFLLGFDQLPLPPTGPCSAIHTWQLTLGGTITEDKL